MTLRGRVKNGVIVLENGTSCLAEGAEVLVTPVNAPRNSGPEILAALDKLPKVPPEWVDELEQLIAEGERPPSPPLTFPDESASQEEG
jgi:hypothetical protein